ncbi:MAG: AMP-binding protein [Ectothiorhodospiraceae bacterium]|nr:AMP-binding protein [Ectothiorhodospiraceae bacterium]
MQLIDFFDVVARRYPQRTAFVQPDGTAFSFMEAAEVSRRLAVAIEKMGTKQDCKISVYSPNDARAFFAMLAIFRAGRVWVPLNARNTVEDNVAFIETVDVELLFYHSAFEDEVRRIREAVPGIRGFVCLDQEGGFGPSVDALIADAEGDVADMPADPERPCAILATGGTTGRSKGAVWTNQVWETLIANFWTSVPFVEHPVHLCVAPMTHAAGVLALMLMPRGPTNIILDKADPVRILEAIQQYRVTHLYLPPTLLYMLLASPKLRDYDASSLQCLLISAAPVSSEKLREAVAAFGPVVCQAFGQAEAPFFLTFLSTEDHRRAIENPDIGHLLRSCGRPTMFSKVAIMGEDGRLLGPGEVGEIVAQGNIVSPGYYNNPEATAEVSAFGWHHTGDLGYRDENDYVFIVDRKKDMIITGGFNVYSTEVEQVILSHSAVQDCAVIGVPDEKWGEAIKAVVELKPGSSAGPEDIISHCRDRLGGVKTPKSIEVWDDLPRSPVGKVLKRRIRERFWADGDRKV